MKDLILKWWNRKWSNWEFYNSENVLNEKNQVVYRIDILKRTSNDGLVQYKTVKR